MILQIGNLIPLNLNLDAPAIRQLLTRSSHIFFIQSDIGVDSSRVYRGVIAMSTRMEHSP